MDDRLVDDRMQGAPEEALLDAMGAIDNLARSSVMENRQVLTKSQADIMIGLSVVGPMSMTQVSEHIAASREQATRAVAPLVERGFVVKTRNPENRRVVTVELTEKGRRDFEEGRARIVEGLRERLDALPNEERERLLTACRVVVDVLRGLRESRA